MKKIGIVVEYNPFHNGHLYQIQKIKEKLFYFGCNEWRFCTKRRSFFFK